MADVAPWLDRWASYAWRLLIVAGAIVAALWLVGRLLVVVIPVAVAVLLARALTPVSSWLRGHRFRPALAALVTVLGFFIVLGGIVTAVGASVVSEFDQLGPTLGEAIDDVEEWLVEDSPFDLDRADLERLREQAGETITDFVSSSQGSVVSGAIVAAEVVVGVILAIIVTFFFVKDGRRMTDRFVAMLPRPRRDLGGRMLGRAWAALGGYLRGAALLGVVESIVIGVTLLIVGADLVAPVMALTVLGAFIPIVGAVVAGIIAILVALVTAGGAGAIVVAVVAVIVQQLDNDLLAPVIYGRALRLHALVILLGITAGGALFGLVGTFLAVPVLAVVLNMLDEARNSRAAPAAPQAG